MSQEVKTPLVVQAPLFPTYAELGEAIKALQGEPIRRVRDMISAVWDQTGTPQSPVDWSEPDKWIPERLSGELQALARKIWEGSKKVLNPRYLYGSYLFVNRGSCKIIWNASHSPSRIEAMYLESIRRFSRQYSKIFRFTVRKISVQCRFYRPDPWQQLHSNSNDR